MLRIGIQRNEYPETRNIISPNQRRIAFEIVGSDYADAPSWLMEQMDRSSMIRTYSASPPTSTRVSGYHYFNTIPVTNVPFLTTFESSVPRWWGANKQAFVFGRRIIASDRCKRLIALSQNAAELMRDYVSSTTTSEQAEAILNKIEVLYPPQPVADDLDYTKFKERHLRLAFVGGDFLRKGGFEFANALDTLLRRNADVFVEVASMFVLRKEDFPWNHDGEAKIRTALDIFDRHPSRVRVHRGRLANSEVLEIFARSHINVLPSFHETFGFSVLEAQSRLCPGLTTDTRAFPEINDAASGWVIEIPNKARLNQIRTDTDNFVNAREAVQKGIIQALEAALADGVGSIERKAQAALDRLSRQHDPATMSDRLFALYQPKFREPWI